MAISLIDQWPNLFAVVSFEFAYWVRAVTWNSTTFNLIWMKLNKLTKRVTAHSVDYYALRWYQYQYMWLLKLPVHSTFRKKISVVTIYQHRAHIVLLVEHNKLKGTSWSKFVIELCFIIRVLIMKISSRGWITVFIS